AARRSPQFGIPVAEVMGYFISRASLGSLTAKSGLGTALPLPREAMAQFAAQTNFDPATLPANLFLTAAVYAGGDPSFVQVPADADAATQRWDPATFDRALLVPANAFTGIKEVEWAKRFSIDDYALPGDSFTGFVLIEQAKAEANLLVEQLLGHDGLFAGRDRDGNRLAPTALDQVAGLWLLTDLAGILADSRYARYGDPVAAERFRTLADRAFAASRTLPPTSTVDSALAVEAYGQYAAVTADAERRQEALGAIEPLGDVLAAAQPAETAELGAALYGLVEASRVTGRASLLDAASTHFLELEARWDSTARVYATTVGAASYTYTPLEVGLVLAGLNALRIFGPPSVAELAQSRLADFFENSILVSGMQLASSLGVQHPALVAPAQAGGPYGRAPVLASQVTYDLSTCTWTVTDARFTTFWDMFLSNQAFWLSRRVVDGFIPVANIPGA
ncbi:MAG: hypothetical protein HY335_10840, partial [Deinococcus sp.]|nr:hypothetical protein [Deinococcus sp.]